MKKFEYEITKHPTHEFAQLAYFCSDTGDCQLDAVPSKQTETLLNILNQQGKQGWELVQLFFGKDGVMASWKRLIE